MNRITGVISAYNTDPENPTITVTSQDNGRDTVVPLWYDRKFGRGLRMGDVVVIQMNKQELYSLKSLVKFGKGEGLDFGDNFIKPYVPSEDKVAQLLVE